MSWCRFPCFWSFKTGTAGLLLMVLPLLSLPRSLSSVSAETLPIRRYSTTQGLAQNYVNRVVIDRRGYVWICTNEGLSRFDGYAFANFGIEDGLPSRNIRDILVTASGEYWLATSGGVVHFNPAGLSARITKGPLARDLDPMFTIYPIFSAGGSVPQVSALVEGASGEIWCGTSAGLFRFARWEGIWRATPIPLSPPGEGEMYVRSLLADRNGDVWVGYAPGLIRYRPSDGRIERFGKADGLPDLEVSRLKQDREGRIWAGTGRGLLELDPQVQPSSVRLARSLFPYATPGGFVRRVLTAREGLPGSWVRDLWQGRDQTFWLATDRGLARVTLQGADAPPSIESYTLENGLTDYFLTSVAGGPDSNLWIGSANAGIMKLSLNGFTTFGARDGLAAAVSVTSTSDGIPLVGGYVLSPFLAPAARDRQPIPADIPYLQWRLGSLDGKRFAWVRPNVPPGVYFSDNWNQSSFQDRAGNWWIATQQGLYQFPPQANLAALATSIPRAIYTTREGLHFNNVTRLFEDRRGDLWITTREANRYALDRWNRASGQLESISHPGGRSLLDDRQAVSFAEDRSGAIWIGLNHNLRRGGLAVYRDGRLKVLDTLPGAPQSNLLDLLVDATGRLWIASTTQGVIRIETPGAEIPTFRYYDRDQGLISNRVTSLAEDHFGRVYCGTGRGVDQINPQTDLIRHFTEADGLALGSVDDIHRDPSGDLWFATTQGLSRFTPTREPQPNPPTIYIDQIRHRGHPYPLSALGERTVVLPHLPPDDHRLEIEYLGLSFLAGDQLRYQAWLEGAEAGWADWGSQRLLTYANLAPGNYLLHLRAVNTRGEVSLEPATVQFTISPPFWLTWWFYSLVAILLFLAGAALQTYRARQLLRVQELRLQISADLHDEVGSSLSQIAILTEVARQQVRRLQGEATSALLSHLEKVAETSRTAIDSMSDIVWSINPQRDSLQDLLQRMRRVASETLTLAEIQLRFDAPDTDLPLAVGARRHLFLFFKEALHNVVRHSQATEVRVAVTLTPHQLVLQLEDNGIGFEPVPSSAALGGGLGLDSLERRAQAIGASLTISSSAFGTTLLLYLPLSRRQVRSSPSSRSMPT